MKVKMLTMSSGPKGTIRAGSIIEVSDREGKLLIGGGYAEKVDSPPNQEEKAGDKPQEAGKRPAAKRQKK